MLKYNIKYTNIIVCICYLILVHAITCNIITLQHSVKKQNNILKHKMSYYILLVKQSNREKKLVIF